MIRVVLDANVLVSGFPATSGLLAELINRWRDGQFSLVLSEHILNEVERAWTKPYWSARFSRGEVRRAVLLLWEKAEVIAVTTRVSDIATHPEDDVVLATASSGSVNYLVTGDKALLALSSHEDVRIVSPRAFVDVLQDLAFRAS